MGGCQPAAAGKAGLSIIDFTPHDHDKLRWKWLSSATVTLGDFGTPTTSTDYTLCVYDNTGLQLSLTAPADGTCAAGKPCWSATSKGFKYVDKELTPDGLLNITLKVVDSGQGKIRVRGKGTNLGLPSTLTLTTPVTVQLKRSDSSTCWEGTFSSPRVNTANKFSSKSD